MTNGSGYQACQGQVDGVDVVRLYDPAHGAELAVASSIGNMAYRFRTAGEEVLWFPFDSPADLKARPAFCGIPFLAPWANRIDGDSYWANGRRYLLNPDLGNFKRDGNGLPIHGLLNYSSCWTVTAAAADEVSAWTSATLDFHSHPSLMAQFPFAHSVTMTHRLSGGVLEVETRVQNLGVDPLPVALGYHPYFCIPGVPRAQWNVHVAARDHLMLNEQLIPTGERRLVAFSDPYPLAGNVLDDVFGDLIRDSDGRSRFWVEGGGRRITVTYGPKYTVAIAYSPADKEFICFEPMAAVTNAFNLAHAGVYRELQSIPPGGLWQESFWVS